MEQYSHQTRRCLHHKIVIKPTALSIINSRYYDYCSKIFTYHFIFALVLRHFPETVLTASGTLCTSCCPLDRAMLPVDLTKLKGVRRTSCIAIVYMSPITQILDPCQSDIMTSCHFSVSYLNYTKNKIPARRLVSVGPLAFRRKIDPRTFRLF